jgi:hypothetical protein
MHLSTNVLFGLALSLFLVGTVIKYINKTRPKRPTKLSSSRKNRGTIENQNLSVFLKKDVLEYILRSEDDSGSGTDLSPSRVVDEES